MRRLPRHLSILVLLAALVAACAHAPAAPAATAPEVVWPEPPAPPRARLESVIPDPDRPRPRRALWRRILEAIVGADDDEREARPLERPFGIAATPLGEVFVADPDLRTVSRVLPGGALAPVTCRGRDWGAPMALAAAPDGALLVADAASAEIVRVARDGRCAAFGGEVLERPTGVAEGGGRVYVADPPRHEITVLDGAGTVVAHLGRRGEGDGELSFPTAVAVGPDGAVLVVDALNFRIARFAPDGRWLGAFGTSGEEEGAFARPKAIAVASDGRAYVSDAQRDVVLVFLADGSLDYELGASGSAPGRFTHPAGVAVAGARLFVADSHNRRIQSFELMGGGRS